jgi:AcrR family transcriptional regulator
MTADERREQILAAATRAFAEHGFAGTTTDQVARVAGVSQPYVVRLFGTKKQLFQTVLERICGSILETFEAVPPGPDAAAQLGEAYVELLHDRDLLRVLMHGFMAGSDPDLGALARRTLVRTFELFQELTGQGVDAARNFVAAGMLINVMMATEFPQHGDEPGVEELLVCMLGEKTAAELAWANR